MSILIEIDDSESIKAMETGRFSDSILKSAPRVIIILTQSWCPDWFAQRAVVESLKERDDLKIYYLEYDKKKFRSEFTSFKETTFQNGLIPYLRFYRNGQFEMDSNFSSSGNIMNWLEQ